MKKTKLLILCIVILSLSLLLTSCIVLPSDLAEEDYYDDMDLFQQVLQFVDATYITGLDVDQADVLASLYVVNGLDDFSNMYATSSLKGATSSGLGLSLSISKYNEYYVDFIYENSPASRVFEDGFSLQRGDEIYAINGERVSGLDRYYFNQATEGGDGTKLALTIKRDGVILEQSYTYEKATFTTKEVYYQNNLGGTISDDLGYIRLMSFTGENTVEDFGNAVTTWRGDNNKGLILDLRGNGGGNSNILAKIASYFVNLGDKTSQSILNFEYKDNGIERIATVEVTDKDNYINAPVYVLCNANTASAAEALIGTIRAFNKDNGVIIGQPTYGKGVCQNAPFTLKDKYGEEIVEYEIAVVTGYYYIIDENVEGGKYNIHQNPIKPDFQIEKGDLYTLLCYDEEIIKANALFLEKN